MKQKELLEVSYDQELELETNTEIDLLEISAFINYDPFLEDQENHLRVIENHPIKLVPNDNL